MGLWVLRHSWPIVPAPDDRRGWLWRKWRNEDWQGNPKDSEKTCPSATLSTTNPTWLDPGSNPGRRGGKPATNRLSYGAALKSLLNIKLFLTRILDEAQECLPTTEHTNCSEASLQFRRSFSCRVLTGSVLLAFVHDEGLYPLRVANYPVLEGGILCHARITVNSRPYQETWMRTWWVRGGTTADHVTLGYCSQLCASSPTLFSYLFPASCFRKYREFRNSFNTYSCLRPTSHVNSCPNFSYSPFLFPLLFTIFHTTSFLFFSFEMPLFYLNLLYFKGRDHMRHRYV
jgi:hypothetical protein